MTVFAIIDRSPVACLMLVVVVNLGIELRPHRLRVRRAQTE